ncbi:hypothetical protein HK100_004227 [Physocladia obscura]|uniref:F-box domain-containing protein n=1 Tax=Physocladia obscura TaxID=109957 RepID=A0AAD5SVB9_9FUNG|nr:hypothetical protein HK100_004227 [Physocladia obscura]
MYCPKNNAPECECCTAAAVQLRNLIEEMNEYRRLLVLGPISLADRFPIPTISTTIPLPISISIPITTNTIPTALPSHGNHSTPQTPVLSPLQQMPSEILDRIADFVDAADILTLSRVMRLYHITLGFVFAVCFDVARALNLKLRDVWPIFTFPHVENSYAGRISTDIPHRHLLKISRLVRCIDQFNAAASISIKSVEFIENMRHILPSNLYIHFINPKKLITSTSVALLSKLSTIPHLVLKNLDLYQDTRVEDIDVINLLHLLPIECLTISAKWPEISLGLHRINTLRKLRLWKCRDTFPINVVLRSCIRLGELELMDFGRHGILMRREILFAENLFTSLIDSSSVPLHIIIMHCAFSNIVAGVLNVSIQFLEVSNWNTVTEDLDISWIRSGSVNTK